MTPTAMSRERYLNLSNQEKNILIEVYIMGGRIENPKEGSVEYPNNQKSLYSAEGKRLRVVGVREFAGKWVYDEDLPAYSTDLNASFKALRKVIHKVNHFCLHHPVTCYDEWVAADYGKHGDQADAPEEAITRYLFQVAGLLATESE